MLPTDLRLNQGTPYNHARRQKLQRAGIMIVLGLLATLVVLVISCSGDDEFTYIEMGTAWHQEPERAYIVQKGDNLHKIAAKYENVSWEDILLANDTLKAKYEQICSKKSAGYRNSSSRRGTFCNDRYNRPYGNTLMPGWTLIIPPGKAPQAIHDIVLENIEASDKIGLLIDDTGSMGNNLREVAQFYSAALNKHGRDNVGIWLYSDGETWKVEDGGFHTSGDTENTHGALKVVADADPDVIILVTDEIGDDWDWDSVPDLPPVIANCIPDGDGDCEGSMSKLATDTHGEFVLLTGF